MTWEPDPPDWRDGNYTGADCENCGRERVMLCTDPKGAERRVCEKCMWDQDRHDYANEREGDEG